MSETPKPEQPADDEPSGAAAEMQHEEDKTRPDDIEDDPSRNPDDESLKDIKGG